VKTPTCIRRGIRARLVVVAIAAILTLRQATAADPVVLHNNDIVPGQDPGVTMQGAEDSEQQSKGFWSYRSSPGMALTEGDFDGDGDEELKYATENGANTFAIGLRHEFARSGDPFLEQIGSHPTFAFECTVLPGETDEEVTSVELVLSLRGQVPGKVHRSLPAHVIPAEAFGLPQSVKFAVGNDEEVKSLLQQFVTNADAKYLNITLTKVSRPAAIGGEGVRNASTVLLDDFRLE